MGEYGTDSFLVKPGRKMFHVVFAGRRDGDGHLFWDCTFPSPFSMCAISLNIHFSCPLDRSQVAYDAYSGMVGCLVLMVLVKVINPGLSSFGELASFHLERCLGTYPVDFSAAWTPPDYWDADDIALETS